MAEEKTRHPFRFLFKLAVFVGIVAAAGKFLVSKKDEYSGLSESEARAKMEGQLSRFGEDKATEIADQVIPVLKDRGLLKENPVAEAVDTVIEAAEDVVEELT